MPYPLLVCWQVAESFLAEGETRLAALVVVQTDCYLRPSEALGLRPEDVLVGLAEAGAEYAGKVVLHLAPGDRGRPTKTGIFDDAVEVGVAGRGWIKDVVATLAHATEPGCQLFPLTLSQYEKAFAQTFRRLQLSVLGGSPHWLRHSGPSNDRFTESFDLLAIQKRGRWAAFKSVSRYEKSADLLKQLSKLTAGQQQSAKRAAASLPKALLHALRNMRKPRSSKFLPVTSAPRPKRGFGSMGT